MKVLGNGRPFALEVVEAQDIPTEQLLKEAVSFITLVFYLKLFGYCIQLQKFNDK